jgi:hypothetical protein
VDEDIAICSSTSVDFCDAHGKGHWQVKASGSANSKAMEQTRLVVVETMIPGRHPGVAPVWRRFSVNAAENLRPYDMAA